MMPREAHRHCSAVSPVILEKRTTLTTAKSRCILLTIICWVIIQLTYPITTSAQPFSQEPRIVTELKEVSEDFGYTIDVNVINNRYTGMQDLHVTPSEGYTYETEKFIRTICAAAATITSQSHTYQTFIDVLMLSINDELWAISTASCRKIFDMTSEATQNAMLKNRLQQLR